MHLQSTYFPKDTQSTWSCYDLFSAM